VSLPQEPTQCQRCRHIVVPVDVAGHTQCPYCQSVIDECCSGETIGLRAESEEASR
jgi:uncharacterized CHY-type Zn-finger protein